MTNIANDVVRDEPRSILGRLRAGLPWEVGLLVLLVVGIYFTRISGLTIRGEESRRATVGMEMIETGDWVVPRQQGDPYFMSSRPPLQAWSIAAVGMIRGGVDSVAVRLPSVLALLLLVLLIYGYSRTFLSRAGAFAAGAMYASMCQVLELGRLGETDLLFTLLLSGSLLTWHWGYTRGWPAVRMWCLAYLLAALATLTKGPQAPVYFAASIGLFLLVSGRWRVAFSRAHACGIGLFFGVFGCWLVPFYLELGWPGVRHVFAGDVGLYLHDWRWTSVAKQLTLFPVEVFLGCLLPWSTLLVAYFDRRFRRTIGSAWGHVAFLSCCIAVAFPTVWLIPGTRSRFLMPLYPCFAILIALVVQRCWEASPQAAYRRTWTRFLVVVAVLMPLGGLAVSVGTIFADEQLGLDQPVPFAMMYLVASLAAAAIAWHARNAVTDVSRVAGVLGVAAFMGLTWTGVVVNEQARRSVRVAEGVAEATRQLPEGVQLVSFGPVNHLFAFHYAKPIRMVSIPDPNRGADQALSSDVTYFCTTRDASLGFPWEEVAVVNCDRNHSPTPDHEVIVGRRLVDPTVARKATASGAARSASSTAAPREARRRR